eukprot:jgi/Psemu1/53833/gm1.53833_g
MTTLVTQSTYNHTIYVCIQSHQNVTLSPMNSLTPNTKSFISLTCLERVQIFIKHTICPTLRFNSILAQLSHHGITPRDYYPEIAHINFCFLPHPAYASIEHLMKSIYGPNIKFTDILLNDGSNLSDFVTTIPNLKNRLLENIHNNALGTRGSCSDNPPDWSSIFIGMDVSPINLHNFEHFAAAATATTTTNTLNQQFVALFNQLTIILQQQSKMLTNINQSRTSPQTLHPCIPMKFDTIANNCYYTFNHTHYRFHTPDQLNLLHNANITPPRQMRYIINSTFPASSFFTRDGAYFVLNNLGASSKKNFRSTINWCKDTIPYALYEWCKTFQAHCVQYRKYCHSYPFFNPTCSHPRRFSLGNTGTHNLPATFMTKIDNNSGMIWGVLYLAFFTIPEYVHTLNQNNRNGYKNLCSILAQLHPLLVEHHATFITVCPTQGKLSLTEDWNKYNHHIMLWALVKHNSQSNLVTSTIMEYLNLSYSRNNNAPTTPHYASANKPTYSSPNKQTRFKNPHRAHCPRAPASPPPQHNLYSISTNNDNDSTPYCNDSNHKFKDCPIFKNDQVLRHNFINLCQLFCCGKKALACAHQITETAIDTTSTP